jgi:hypothetical protein
MSIIVIERNLLAINREVSMKHQSVQPAVKLNDRPIRDTIIQKDDIISLIIDVNLLSADEFICKYCLTTTTESPIEIAFPEK